MARVLQVADYRNHDVNSSFQYKKEAFESSASSEKDSGEEDYVSCDSGTETLPETYQDAMSGSYV